jgi:hypothetical protein
MMKFVKARPAGTTKFDHLLNCRSDDPVGSFLIGGIGEGSNIRKDGARAPFTLRPATLMAAPSAAASGTDRR